MASRADMMLVEEMRVVVVEETPPQKDEAPPQQIVNKTARRIGIRTRQDTSLFIVPPFGRRPISAGDLAKYDWQSWADLRLICKEKAEDNTAASSSKPLHFFGVIGFIVCAVSGFGLLPFVGRAMLQSDWRTAGLLVGLIICFGLLGYVLNDRAKVNAGQVVYQLMLVLVTIGAPLITLYALGQSADVFRAGDTDTMTFVATGGKILTFIAIASLLPALFYFIFTRQHLATLQKTFYRETMIFDRSLVTEYEAEQRYEDQVNEIYGSQVDKYPKTGTALPVLICTMLITLNWMMVLLPIGEGRAFSLTDFLDLKNSTANLTNPHLEAFNYGFLGTYFFGIGLLFRRYVRADLTPKAYSNITVRIILTTTLVWTVSTFVPNTNNALYPLAFLIGIFPETGGIVIQEFLQKALGGSFKSLEEKHPISELEGVNLYDQARLLEEGIENIEGMAHCQMIDLRLNTRIPMGRIVDWIDQAILILHLGYDDQTELRATREILRRFGIRTATDFLRVGHTALADELEREIEKLKNVAEMPPQTPLLIQFVKMTFSFLHPPQPAKPDELKTRCTLMTLLGARLETIQKAMEDDEWIDNLHNWRSFKAQRATVTNPTEFYLHMRHDEPPTYPHIGQPRNGTAPKPAAQTDLQIVNTFIGNPVTGTNGAGGKIGQG